MAVSGARAKRFIRPAQSGASAVFARQRGMVAAAPSSAMVKADPEEKLKRSGKATGSDYKNFFSSKRNTSAMQKAVNALKGLLVGAFIAAKSMGATLKAIGGQLKGIGKGGKGGGFFGTLGTVGLVAAVVVGVASFFGPQIQKAFGFVKEKSEELFQNAKGGLASVDEKIKTFYEKIRVFFNKSVIPTIEHFNQILPGLTAMAKSVSELPPKLKIKALGMFDIDVDLGFLSGAKKAAKKIYDVLDNIKPISVPEKLKPYRDTVDADGNPKPGTGLLGRSGINFLSSYDTLGDFGGAMGTGAGNLAMGGIDSMTGFVGDIVNNMLQALGFTDSANKITEMLGLGKQFGASRQLGSGPGISSLFPGGSWQGLGSSLQGLGSSLGLGGGNQTQSQGSNFTGTGRQQEIYNYLKSKGMSHNHAMGLMANIMRESSFKTDPGMGSSGEIGMFQWNPQAGRSQPFAAAVPDWKTNWKGQIDYALQEYTGPQYLRETFNSEQEAADYWMNEWEKPTDRVGGSKKHAEYLKNAPISGAAQPVAPQPVAPPQGTPAPATASPQPPQQQGPPPPSTGGGAGNQSSSNVSPKRSTAKTASALPRTGGNTNVTLLPGLGAAPSKAAPRPPQPLITNKNLTAHGNPKVIHFDSTFVDDYTFESYSLA